MIYNFRGRVAWSFMPQVKRITLRIKCIRNINNIANLGYGNMLKLINTIFNQPLEKNLLGVLRFNIAKVREKLKKDVIVFGKLRDTDKVFSKLRNMQQIIKFKSSIINRRIQDRITNMLNLIPMPLPM